MSKPLNISQLEYLNFFYKEHENDLCRSYPGLGFPRFKRELEAFCLEHQAESERALEGRYIPNRKGPVQYFLAQVLEGIPLEYIRGRAYFYRSEFKVTPAVLIPRNETEIIVELIVTEAREVIKSIDEKLKICDVGTGAGVILLSILQELSYPTDGIGTDISPPALEVAKRNYYEHRYQIFKFSDARFIETDRLSDLEEKFHFIVSNPPYIKTREDRSLVHPQVDQYEPAIALYIVDEEYDQWFRDFFIQVKNSLLNEGVFMMEGHEDHLKDLATIASHVGLNHVRIVKDYNDRDRFLIAKK